MRGVVLLLSVLSVVSFFSTVKAHSWVQCVDYTEENGRFWDVNKCRGWPRNYQEAFRYTQPPHAFGADAGYDWKPNDNQGKVCKYNRNPSSDYTASYPKATYSPGQRVCMAWPPKNHVAAQCNNPNTPDSGTKIYRSGLNPTTDPTLDQFHQNLVFDFGVNTGTQGKAFQNCPDFCDKPGDALCTGCFVIPNNLALGTYTFLWEWAFNGVNDLYTNCFEVDIVANSGKTITSTLEHITPDAFKAAKAASTTGTPTLTGSPTSAPTPAPTSGGSAPTPASASGGSTPTPTPTPTPSSAPTTPAPQTSGGAPSGATILFNGNFNEYSTSTDLDTWSWANQGTWPYQTYIFGNTVNTNKMSTFVTLGTEYHNGARDGSATRGVNVRINQNSLWNSGTNLRTELVVAPSRLPAAAFQGTKYFHFSLRQASTNQLNAAHEHQIMFFEAHFADIKFGGSFGNNLNFVTSSGNSAWTSAFTPNVWHNFAILVDFSGNRVGLHYSTGANALQQVVAPTASNPSNSDWHVGLLRLTNGGNQASGNSDLQICSVYIADNIISFTGAINNGGTTANNNAGTTGNNNAGTTGNNNAGTTGNNNNAGTTANNNAGTTANNNAGTTANNNAGTTANNNNNAGTTGNNNGGSTTQQGTTPTNCNIGSVGCSCTSGKGCDPGLVCASNICINPSAFQLGAASTVYVSFVLVVVALLAMLL